MPHAWVAASTAPSSIQGSGFRGELQLRTPPCSLPEPPTAKALYPARGAAAPGGAGTAACPLQPLARRAPSYWRRVAIFCNTSPTTASGTRVANSACRARQSRLFTWSESTTPETCSGGSCTSKG